MPAGGVWLSAREAAALTRRPGAQRSLIAGGARAELRVLACVVHCLPSLCSHLKPYSLIPVSPANEHLVSISKCVFFFFFFFTYLFHRTF